MVTEQNIEDMYNDYCYDNYYRKSKKWNEYYENMEEREDFEND